MKILQVIPFFTPARGRTVNIVYHLSKQLASRNHDITIVTTDFEFDESYANILRKKGVKIIPFHCTVNLKMLLYSPSLVGYLKKNLKDFDVVHLHNFRTYQNIVVRRYAKKYGVPIILQAHGSVLKIIEKQRLKKVYDWIWGNKLLHDSSIFIAVSKVEIDQ